MGVSVPGVLYTLGDEDVKVDRIISKWLDDRLDRYSGASKNMPLSTDENDETDELRDIRGDGSGDSILNLFCVA